MRDEQKDCLTECPTNKLCRACVFKFPQSCLFLTKLIGLPPTGALRGGEMKNVLFLTVGLLSANVTQAEDARSSSTYPGLYVFGDSLSTGVLADTRFADFYDFMKKLKSGVRSTAFNCVYNGICKAKDEFSLNQTAQRSVSRYDLAALSTTQEWGLRRTLADQFKIELDQVWYENESQFGLKAESLVDQLRSVSLHHESQNRKIDPSHIAVFIGTNDLCHGSSPDQLEGQLRKGLVEIRARFPQSQVLLAQLPPYHLMIGHVDYLDTPVAYYPKAEVVFEKSKFFSQNIARPRIAGAHFAAFTCKDAIEKFCPRLFKDYTVESANELNESIRKLSSELNLTLVDGVSSVLPEPENFAADCFHLSAAGQQRVAESFIEKIKITEIVE